MLRLGSQSLTGKVLRLGLKPKDISFKMGAIRPGFVTAYVASFHTRVLTLNPVAILAIDQIGPKFGIHGLHGKCSDRARTRDLQLTGIALRPALEPEHLVV
ncbi:hypothetical protein DPMN_113138 [Dreissena polymorpha]|uniref:Uncharacterized protein n=1 Tax=Dreissena polymorpha TaxID=45954 RepID=A0A9D4KGZ3_DREPO|nr:hypothetical protein DPMN_113138 [Dreissena polymorpha]